MVIKIRKNTDKYALLFRKKIERWLCCHFRNCRHSQTPKGCHIKAVDVNARNSNRKKSRCGHIVAAA